ncbi:MAG: sulfatase-like hydrolase/transferase [Betaproteobacteria bacterium]|nr:sulfatase-like hydrolase/transferase [Betaproteobacteria bacterium]
MKNLLILHLESITRQRLATFGSSFPNTRRLMQDALVFDNFFSSATSTLMVVTYLFHGNDFEFDAASEFEGMRAAVNNRNLFSVLQSHGYNADLICLNAFHAQNSAKLASWSDDLPPLWATNDFPSLLDRFDKLTNSPPFAIYVWDLITHIEHSLALAPFSSGLTDQIQRACGVADDAVGVMLATLERKGLLDNTTIVIYGDHGDDYWTHGFKGGMVHATEPYTQITGTPLAIRDPGLTPGINDNLASTIDIAPTCLALLGIDETAVFPHTGTNLLMGASALVFSQNFTANQPDNLKLGIAKAFAATDNTYNLLVSSRGLELYAYRLDPGNHCNLLHFFDVMPDGRLELRKRPGLASHFRMALKDNPRAVANLTSHFGTLRTALAGRIAAKRAYITASGVVPSFALDPRCLNTVDYEARTAFFRCSESMKEARESMPIIDISFKI